LRDSSAPVRAMGSGRKLRLQSLLPGVPDEDIDVSPVLQSVSTELLMRAAVDGMGVVVTSRLLAEDHLARGELVHILPSWIFSRYTIYAALPSGRMLPARTKVFLDFLTEQVPIAMAEQRAQLS
jgi:DNA-binding transcriptional LysR family regulator